MRRLIVKPLADIDLRTLNRTSKRNHGVRAARAYDALVRRAYRLLCTDPDRPGVTARENLPAGVRLFHLRHARTRGVAPKQPRHVVAFSCDDTTLTVLRLLHDAMDIEARLAPGDE